MSTKQPFGGKYWRTGLVEQCTKHTLFSIRNPVGYCLLCKIAELEEQRDSALEELGIKQGILDGLAKNQTESGAN